MPVTNLSLPETPAEHTLLTAACAVIILAGMSAVASILNALLLAILVALVCLPLQSWFHRRGLSQTLSFTVTVLISLLVGISAVLVFAFSIVQVMNALPSYQAQLQAYFDPVKTQLYLLGLSPETLGDTVLNVSQSIVQLAIDILKSVGDTLGTVLLMYLFLFYLLVEGEEFDQYLRSGPQTSDRFRVKLVDFFNTTRRYLNSRTLIGAGIAVIQTGVMLALGVDFAVLWGLLSFICNFIPNIGFLIGLLPPAAMLFLEQGPIPTIPFVILYSATNMVIENVVAPKFIGAQVNLSPLTVFVSLVFWSWVLGPLGILLGLPMTLFIKSVLLDTDPTTKTPVVLTSVDSQSQETRFS
jgi:AI-2 transport protein TqsA